MENTQAARSADKADLPDSLNIAGSTPNRFIEDSASPGPAPEPRFPDFFVVGAPRCGTTAFCRYLERNPQICFSRPKEPHYFTRVDHAPSAGELRRDYLNAYFGHYSEEHRALGEGSVSYLYLPETIERIRHIDPAAKFIALVRSPFRMLPSYHLKMLYLLQEDQEDIAKAWDLQTLREQGKSIPRRCLDPQLLMYSEVARFGAQIKRLFEIAGRDRCHIVVLDDIKAKPLETYKSAIDFIGVDYDGQTDFEPRYASRTYRYRWLQQLLYIPATLGGKKLEALHRRTTKYNRDGTKRKRKSWIRRIVKFNKVTASPAPLSPQMRETVRAELLPDVELLSDLLGRDLRHWLDL